MRVAMPVCRPSAYRPGARGRAHDPGHPRHHLRCGYGARADATSSGSWRTVGSRTWASSCSHSPSATAEAMGGDARRDGESRCGSRALVPARGTAVRAHPHVRDARFGGLGRVIPSGATPLPSARSRRLGCRGCRASRASSQPSSNHSGRSGGAQSAVGTIGLVLAAAYNLRAVRGSVQEPVGEFTSLPDSSATRDLAGGRLLGGHRGPGRPADAPAQHRREGAHRPFAHRGRGDVDVSRLGHPHIAALDQPCLAPWLRWRSTRLTAAPRLLRSRCWGCSSPGALGFGPGSRFPVRPRLAFCVWVARSRRCWA